jgi:hypothetical protein
MRSLYVEDIPGKIMLTKAPSQKDTYTPRKLFGRDIMKKCLDLPETLNKKES